MHPLLNQQLAIHHMQALQHEAEAARVEIPEEARSHRSHLNFLRFWYDRTGWLSRRSVVREEARPEVVNIEEIRPALVSTFSTMHHVGLVSEYNDQFVEKFVQTFERELEHQTACK